MAQITVTDTGIGIDRDFLPYLFERFRQADSSITRQYQGLGLGLAIVRHLVELHGGTIRADSDGPGQGATFSVRLPITALCPEESPEEARAESPDGQDAATEPAGAASLAGLRVLVVEDEPDSRELLVAMLQQYGARADAAGSASEALQLLDEVKPDLLLSDIGLPGEDGYSLLRRVRERRPERGGRIPAIALTAYAKTEDRIRALHAGFQTHIAKPVEPDELAAVIASVAGIRQT